MKLEGKSPWSLAAAGHWSGIAVHQGASVVIDYRSHPEGAEETLAKVQAVEASAT